MANASLSRWSERVRPSEIPWYMSSKSLSCHLRQFDFTSFLCFLFDAVS